MTSIVTLSQAPQNGWETWFSLQYGTQLSKLKASVERVKSHKMKTYQKEMEAKVKDANKVIDNPPEKGAPAWKYYVKRKQLAQAVVADYQVFKKFLS